MLVAHIAPIFATVPPAGYGGVERVIEELTAVQTDACDGVDVIVLASADSRPTAPSAGRYASIRSRPSWMGLGTVFEEMRRHYLWAFEEASRRGADIVHLHGPWGLEYGPAGRELPAVASIYDDTSRPDVSEPLLTTPEGVYLVANSESNRKKAPQVPWFSTVLEGVIVDRYPMVQERGGCCCFVGELIPDKGLDIAVAAARTAEVPLKVIGRPRVLDLPAEVVDEQQRYLERVLYPHVDGPWVEYLGELGEDRLPVIAAARALLAPARIEEPFGRVMAEAMACGTPVITFSRGSAPEIIEHGVSGFAVDTEAEMAAALRQASSLAPEACRAHARRVLNMDRVGSAYADLYRAVLNAGPPHGSASGPEPASQTSLPAASQSGW